MNLVSLGNIPSDSIPPGSGVIICPECNQSYMFEAQCPTCAKRAKEKTESLLLSARIKNMTDYISMGDLFEVPLEKLQKLDNLITSILKEKSHGKANNQQPSLNAEITEAENGTVGNG